jgi:3-deoxy-D-manno-octulosonic-acid transferase
MYNLLVFLLRAYLTIRGYFNPRIHQWNSDRHHQTIYLKTHQINPDKDILIWIHCASHGEYQQIVHLINLIKERIKNAKLLVTFFSPSGFENVTNSAIDYKYYLPLENRNTIKLFIQNFKPLVFIGVKYEWWWNLFDVLNKHKIPKLLIAVKLDQKHYIFKWFSERFRRILRENTTMLVQDKESLENAKSLDIQKVEIGGDPRIDSVIKIKNNLYKNKELILKTADNRPIIVYGSVYQEDINLIQTTVTRHPDKFHIIVPHDISDKNINLFVKKLDCECVITQLAMTGQNTNRMIVNTIGELFGLYSIADYCYIGGGFTKNVHNTLEPAIYGLPIAIGPKHKGFREIEYFKRHQLIKIVNENTGFSEFLESLQKENIQQLDQCLRDFFLLEAGGSKKIIDLIRNKLHI